MIAPISQGVKSRHPSGLVRGLNHSEPGASTRDPRGLQGSELGWVGTVAPGQPTMLHLNMPRQLPGPSGIRLMVSQEKLGI